MKQRIFLSAMLALLGFGLTACGASDTPRTTATAIPDETFTPHDDRPASPTRVTLGLRDVGLEGDAQTMMQVEPSPARGPRLVLDELEDVCRDLSVYFDTDSAELTAETRAALDQLAICFEHADLRGIEIEGHADPRGSEAYNRALAMRRARAVSQYLRERGVDEPNVEVASAGESAARWRFYWADDRRVDIDSHPRDDWD